MKDSFKNYYFLAQNFDNQALKLHLPQLQILLVWRFTAYFFFTTCQFGKKRSTGKLKT